MNKVGRKRKHPKEVVMKKLVEMHINKLKKEKLKGLIGPATLQEVGDELGYTRENIRLIYEKNKDIVDAEVEKEKQNIKI